MIAIAISALDFNTNLFLYLVHDLARWDKRFGMPFVSLFIINNDTAENRS